MSRLLSDCARPERCVVGHPFNPPDLIPLVEVVGGERTDPAAVDWLAAFYTFMGKRPLRLSRELPGFVGNRLQEAMWRGGGAKGAPRPGAGGGSGQGDAGGGGGGRGGGGAPPSLPPA